MQSTLEAQGITSMPELVADHLSAWEFSCSSCLPDTVYNLFHEFPFLASPAFLPDMLKKMGTSSYVQVRNAGVIPTQ